MDDVMVADWWTQRSLVVVVVSKLCEAVLKSGPWAELASGLGWSELFLAELFLAELAWAELG